MGEGAVGEGVVGKEGGDVALLSITFTFLIYILNVIYRRKQNFSVFSYASHFTVLWLRVHHHHHHQLR